MENVCIQHFFGVALPNMGNYTNQPYFLGGKGFGPLIRRISNKCISFEKKNSLIIEDLQTLIIQYCIKIFLGPMYLILIIHNSNSLKNMFVFKPSNHM